jgi:hypothetical protein
MALPGGLVCDNGAVDRTYAWKPLDGTVELAIAVAARAPTRPQAVSEALHGALAAVGGGPVTRDRVDALSVTDRRFLMIELACLLGQSFAWSTHACAACRAPFDVSLDLADLPVGTAGESYPSQELSIGGRRVRVRAPAGADQIRIAGIADKAHAARFLAERCITPCDDSGHDGLGELSTDDLALIDAAVESLSPGQPWAMEAACPECRSINLIPIDVTGWLARLAEGPTRDVHEIAMAYGWSERDILALPRSQRQKYIALIRGRRGEVEVDWS